MRRLLHFLTVTGILLAGWAAPPPLAQAATLDTIADHVLGQANFSASAANEGGGITGHSLAIPTGVAFDAQGNLYVTDANNNRVLEYDDPLTTDHIADKVFGQADLTHGAANSGGISAHSLDGPNAVALDGQGNLYVADFFNNRVLEYDAPLTSGQNADRVFGQPDFTHATNSMPTASSLAGAAGVALDGQGNLYVVDYLDSRVLEYNAPLSSDRVADRVFGQPDFIHDIVNNGGISASSLDRPSGLALDASGNLYVADKTNHRVLEYNAPLTSDAAADRVFGQGGDFTTNDDNHGGISADSLSVTQAVALDAKGDLYVADGNNRVLEYNTPLSSDTTADRLFGQPNFSASAPNNGGISASRLNNPQGVALDPLGNLAVVDSGNNRVLGFDLPIGHDAPTLTAISPLRVAAGSPPFILTVTGAVFYGNSVVRWNGSNRPTTFIDSTRLTATISAADISGGGPFAVTVFTPAPGGGITSLINLTLYIRAGHDTTADTEQGQPNFVASSANNAHMLGANHLNSASGVAVDRRTGRLFVADEANNRVLSWANAAAQANGQAADLVLGQPNLTTITANAGGLSAKSLNDPFSVALDGLGNLYVGDTFNNRVLEYPAPLSSGMAASHVFGQGGSFISAAVNNGGTSANSLNGPGGLALDTLGNLYVADISNNRVLEYDSPLTTNTTADHVFGQPNFGSNDFNHGGLNANSLYGPYGVGLDPAGNMYVADASNHRVLEYNAPLTTDHTADHVFGQPNFTTANANQGGRSAASLNDPLGVALDGWGNLYVADHSNNRVLEFDLPLSNASADRVFGQPDFSAGMGNNGGVSANSLAFPSGAALDAGNNLYVADLSNNRVLEYDWALAKLELPLLQR